VGGCTPKGANSMAASGLSCTNNMVGTGRAISVLFGMKLETSNLILTCRASFPVFKTHFSAIAGWQFSGDVTRHLLVGGCVYCHVSSKDG